MPELTVVIGGNGAGKTTWAAEPANRAKLPKEFYNADTLARGLGDWNDEKKQREARAIVDGKIEERLKNREDFGFESTYSGRSRPGIVQRAKAAGYKVNAIFVGTKDREINVQRVEARAASGTGHSVAASEIRRRWTAAQENLVKTCRSMDSITVIDNSDERGAPGNAPEIRIVGGRVASEQRPLPDWIAKLKDSMNPQPQHEQRLDRAKSEKPRGWERNR